MQLFLKKFLSDAFLTPVLPLSSHQSAPPSIILSTDPLNFGSADITAVQNTLKNSGALLEK
jgi:hypothetical protein